MRLRSKTAEAEAETVEATAAVEAVATAFEAAQWSWPSLFGRL